MTQVENCNEVFETGRNFDKKRGTWYGKVENIVSVEAKRTKEFALEEEYRRRLKKKLSLRHFGRTEAEKEEEDFHAPNKLDLKNSRSTIFETGTTYSRP